MAMMPPDTFIKTALLTRRRLSDISKRSGESVPALTKKLEAAEARNEALVIAWIDPADLERINKNLPAFMEKYHIDGITEMQFRQHLGKRVEDKAFERTAWLNAQLDANEAERSGT